MVVQAGNQSHAVAKRTDATRVRHIDTGVMPDRYARGWHCLGPVKEFLDGKPHEIDAFGTKLVVFADSHSDLKVLDAYCRHMGGNLSRGTIKGDEIACPFHDWRWGGDGLCKLVPYAKRTPKLARTQSWLTDVHSGLLFVWQDFEGKTPAPELRVPVISEWGTDEWTDWRWDREIVPANCRDIIDNVVDLAHFFYIHFGFPTYFKTVFENHIASQYLHTEGRPDLALAGLDYAGKQILDSEAAYFGPSFMINWLHNNYSGYKAESILIFHHYPITQESFMLQWGVIVQKPKGMDEKTVNKLAEAFTAGVTKGFMQDVEMWRNKAPRIDNPLLVEEDGALYQLRRWYQQFYVDIADVTTDMTDRYELEVDTSKANEHWRAEVDENMRCNLRPKSDHDRDLGGLPDTEQAP